MCARPNFAARAVFSWNYEELADYGASGLGTAATREKGARFKRALVDHLVAFLARKDEQGWIIPKRQA